MLGQPAELPNTPHTMLGAAIRSPPPPPPNSPPRHHWGADTAAPWAPCLDKRMHMLSRTTEVLRVCRVCIPSGKTLMGCCCDCLCCGIEGYGQHSAIHVHCTHIKHETITSSHVRDSMTAQRHAAAANASNVQGLLLMWREGAWSHTLLAC
jgi:hypothetical protein